VSETEVETTAADEPGLWQRISSALSAVPYPAMVVGALAISANAVFLDLSDTSTGTSSFYRCAIAVPALALLARSERRRSGSISGRQRLLAVVAGAFFAGDILLWTQAIFEVGAGLSTVLVNAQVVIVPVLALVFDNEAIGLRYLVTLPFMTVGVVLTGGVLESGLSGSDPVLGTVHAVLAAACYSGFLYLLRRGGKSEQRVQSFRDVIASAAIISLILGAFWHGVDLAPGWSAIVWISAVAVCGPIVGWTLIAVASPRLRSQTGAALLLLTPAGALVLGAIVLDERPTTLQLAGCALMLASAYVASAGEARTPQGVDPPAARGR
jgi:drug/metabolite transporter (DMT)-like permease